jgi:hypothetical protein
LAAVPPVPLHEAYRRLVAEDHLRWQNRSQLSAVAAELML